MKALDDIPQILATEVGMNALMAYAIGAVGIVIGALVNFKKEVNKGV